jgi:hypothetical protein
VTLRGRKGEDMLPEGETEGRSVVELKSRLKSLPVRTVKGRPDASSKIGATVKFATNLRAAPRPAGAVELRANLDFVILGF